MMLRFRYRGIGVFWFMEFQQRGACHFHLIVDREIKEEELKRMWYDVVGSGDKRHLEHGAHIAPIRKIDSYKKYLSAYLTKEEQKKVPYFYQNAGRFWGYSRHLVNVNISVIVGTKTEIQTMRRNFRLFRRWQKARLRQWNKSGKSKRRMRQMNPYANIVPGDHLFILNARDFISACAGKNLLHDELFEDWGERL